MKNGDTVYIFNGNTIRPAIFRDKIDGLKNAYRIEYKCPMRGIVRDTTIKEYICCTRKELIDNVEDHIYYLQRELERIKDGCKI